MDAELEEHIHLEDRIQQNEEIAQELRAEVQIADQLRIETQDAVYRVDQELQRVSKEKFELEMEIEKYSRKQGRQPTRKSVQR